MTTIEQLEKEIKEIEKQHRKSYDKKEKETTEEIIKKWDSVLPFLFKLIIGLLVFMAIIQSLIYFSL